MIEVKPNIAVTAQQPPIGSNGVPKPAGIQQSLFFRTLPADRAAKRPDAEPVQRIVYPEVSDTDYGIRHIKEKPSLGLAMSGGGFRAATCAAGWTRGLHKTFIKDAKSGKNVNVLSKVKYVATTSGGSWFNSALSYTGPIKEQVPLDTFLGEVKQPHELELDVIKQKPPPDSFDWVLAEHSVLDSLLGSFRTPLAPLIMLAKKKAVDLYEDVFGPWNRDDLTHRPRWMEYWTHGVAESFLKPYGLNIYENCTLTAAGTTGDIQKRAKGKARHTLVACTDRDRPYPILMGSAFNPPGEDGYQAYPYEFTPLYFGTPGAFPKSDPPLGGGYVEPWALNSVPLTPCVDGNGPSCTCSPGALEVDRSEATAKACKLPLNTVPLAQAMSISSSFLAAAFHNKRPFAQMLASTEKLMNWGLMNTATEGQVTKPSPPKHELVRFADGGMVDNLGISALLRRGVRCMIVCSASSAAPDDSWEKYAAESNDVACWFGAARAVFTPGISPSEFNDACQVFGKTRREGEKLFQDLFDDVHAKLRAGRPGFHRGRYRVYENHYHNIPASAEGEEVEVLWIFNHQWGDWEDSLHDDTKAQLSRDRQGQGIHPKSVMKRELLEGELRDFGGFMTQRNLYRFPYFTTFSLDYAPEAVHMLGQLSSAVILDPEVQGHVKDLVRIASKA